MIGQFVSRACGAALLAACLSNQANAQAFSEDFNDITSLAGNGWVTANNSVAVGSTGWFQGSPVSASGPFDSYNGASNAYIAANYNNTGNTGTISNWLMTPNRTLRNGDVLTFFTRKPSPDSYADRLEFRLSTNGASTNAGTGSSVGDFSTLLLSINPNLVLGVYPTTWTQYTVTISGLPAPTSGRMAFRYFVTGAGVSGTNSDYIGIDAVNYTPYVCPAFTLNPAGGSLTAGNAGLAYNRSFSQTGALGSPAYAVTAGALPPGLTLSAGGTISGSPTALGTFNFAVTVSDNSGCTGSAAYSLSIAPAQPPMPGFATAIAGNTTADVSWNPLSVDPYGTSIDSYTVTAVGDPSKTCTTGGSGSGCTVTGLTNGVSYSFNVVAASAGGTSPTATTNSVVPSGTQTINFPQPASQVYGGILTPVATASSGLTVSFSVSGPCQLQPSGDILFTGAGNCVVTASQVGNAAFAAAPDVPRTVVIAKAAQTITFTSVTPSAAQIGGTYNVAATGGASGNAVTFAIAPATSANCSIAGTTVHFDAAGACTINANQLGDANYNDAAQAQQTFGIGVASQTINFPQPAAQVVGGSLTPQATASSSLLVSFGVSGPCQLVSGSIRFTGVGSCVVTASQAGDATYGAALDVVRTISVGQGSQSIAFTSAAPTNALVGGTYTVVATGGASGNPVTFAVSPSTIANCSVSGSTISFLAVGTCTIVANELGNANYSAAPPAQLSFAIAAAPETPHPVPMLNQWLLLALSGVFAGLAMAGLRRCSL